MACEELRKAEEIVNKHLRTNSDVSDITMTVMTSSVKDFLINLDMTREVNSKHCYTIGGCNDCINVKDKNIKYKQQVNISDTIE